MTTDSKNNTNTVVPALTLQNLLDALQLIDLAIKRGAYQPKELRQVSDIYETIELFLKHEELKQAARIAQQGEK